jgi:hypothetical protein
MIIKGIPAYWKITNNKEKQNKSLKCIMLKTEFFNLQRKQWNLCVQNVSAKSVITNKTHWLVRTSNQESEYFIPEANSK